MDRIIKLSDRRTLSFAEYGDLNGFPVLFFHGGPGSRIQGRYFEDVAAEQGIRLIALDRPGMGQSDYLEGRTLLDTATDVAELSNELGFKKFAVLGWSGGGPHALACAYAIPDRLAFVGILAGFPPLNFSGAIKLLDKADQFAYKAAQKQPMAFRMFFRMMRLGALSFPGRYFNQIYQSSSNADRHVLSMHGVRELMIQDTTECFRKGSKGLAHDARLEYGDWGFDLNKIVAPVHIWQGTDDHFVHFKLGEHMAHSIPQATFHKLKDAGHFFPINNKQRIFKVLKEQIRPEVVAEA